MSDAVTQKPGIPEIQDEIIDEFSLFDDWQERYKYLIEMGRDLQPLDDQFKKDDLKIKGCQSNVWLHPYLKEDRLFFESDSDAMIVKGLVALLIRVLSGQKPADIARSELYFIDKIGMKENLSPTRSNGLASMVRQMKLYGVAYEQKLQKKS